MKRDLLIPLALACVLSACKVSGDYGNTRFQCDPGDTCPSGYECIAGFCEFAGQGADAAPGPDARPPSDASTLDGTVPQAATCGTLNVLSEDFAGSLIELALWDVWTYGAVSITHSNGQLSLGYPADTGDIGGGYYSTGKRHLIEDGRASVEIVEVNPDAQVELNLEVKDLDDELVRIRQYQDTLAFIYKIGSNQLEIGSVPFDPVVHRFWQLREADGMIHWETSPDGMSWTTHETRPSEALLEFGEMQVWYWLLGPVAGGGQLVVDNLNGGTPSEVPWCPATSVTDDFSTSERADVWAGWDKPGCTRVFANGVFTFDTVSDGREADCGITSRAYLDASAGAIAVEVPQVADGVATYFSLWPTNDDRFEFFYSDGRIYFEKTVGKVESTLGSLKYDAAAHRWWRFLVDGDTIDWQTSSDGSTWMTQVSHTGALSLGEVEVGLWFYMPNADGQSRLSWFDNFNLTP